MMFYVPWIDNKLLFQLCSGSHVLFIHRVFDLCHFLNTEIMVLLDCVHMIWIIAFMVYTN
ncbi:hypothetical protein HanRHA438_Chr04g0199361 [Helianthus annuus]|nr:hypothetical protein HanRHA438_Chr04g0199361 [Helianthus annuus]